MDSDSRYEQLLAHAEHHNVKQWLLDGAKHEDAYTLYAAIERQSSHRLARKLAEILAK